MEKEIDPDKIFYGVSDKYLFDNRYPNLTDSIFTSSIIENNRFHRLVHTIMDDKNDLLDYVRSVDKQQAKAIKKSGNNFFDFNERYIVSFTEVDKKTIKIIKVEKHENDFLILI